MNKSTPASVPFSVHPVAVCLLVTLMLLVTSGSAGLAETAMPAALTGKFAAAIVIDADTGEILVANNINTRRQPASMIKMLTELIVLDKVAEGDVSFTDQVTISAKASRMGGSQVYLKHNEIFTVEELLQALAIHSANDAAVALAEHVAGTTEAFVDLMNLRAAELGMRDTEIHSVHGLPASRGQKPDLTSAFDLALLGRHLIQFPEALRWSSTAKSSFRDGEFDLYNPNKLIGRFRGLDGIKTGYHKQAGFCVTASAVQKGKRLISVVMGAPTDEDRATETTRLLSYGFNLFTQVTLVEEGRTPLDERRDLKGGKQKQVAVAYVGPLVVGVPKDRIQDVLLRARFGEELVAPLEEGEEVGEGVALLDGFVLGRVPIVTIEAVAKGSWLDRLFK
ncbi:MAG: D-alanyl-D-alanine carboxypeptidase family protein [bacterium]